MPTQINDRPRPEGDPNMPAEHQRVLPFTPPVESRAERMQRLLAQLGRPLVITGQHQFTEQAQREAEARCRAAASVVAQNARWRDAAANG